MSAAVEGSQVDLETATRIESRYFVDLVTGPISTNISSSTGRSSAAG